MKNLSLFIIFILITGLFFSCEEVQPDLSPGPTAEPPPAPFQPSFVEFQGIETNGAYDWEYFSIGERHFLAVANYYNGTTRNIDSKIYEWNGFAFSPYQSLGTNGALDWKYFSIEGDHYLVVANYYNNTTYNINSAIYKWDFTTELFAPYTTIGTNGAFDWEYFSIGDDHFIVVANYYNESTRNINSVVYKWNGVNFATHQPIGTNGAFDWEYFSIDGDHYLVVANYSNDSTSNINSKIYKWNTSTLIFDEYQTFATNSARRWKYFSIGDDHYIAVANSYSGSTNNINSRIYKWNPGTEFFNLHQAIPTNGAADWDFFSIEENHFLTVANYNDDVSYNISSTIYSWDNTQEQFSIYRTIATSGARDLEYFAIEDELFLAVANSYNGTTYNINSKIYKVLY